MRRLGDTVTNLESHTTHLMQSHTSFYGVAREGSDTALVTQG